MELMSSKRVKFIFVQTYLEKNASNKEASNKRLIGFYVQQYKGVAFKERAGVNGEKIT